MCVSQVQLDGEDIRELNIAWLRNQIGVVSQEPVLFANSIKANIAYGCDREVSQEEIEAAAQSANAHSFIMDLPEVWHNSTHHYMFLHTWSIEMRGYTHFLGIESYLQLTALSSEIMYAFSIHFAIAVASCSVTVVLYCPFVGTRSAAVCLHRAILDKCSWLCTVSNKNRVMTHWLESVARSCPEDRSSVSPSLERWSATQRYSCWTRLPVLLTQRAKALYRTHWIR